MDEKIMGVLLAGGQSKRFGSPKMFAERNGIAFFKHSLQALAPFVSKTCIVTLSSECKAFLHLDQNVKIITDLEAFQSQGPLAGILSGMVSEPADWYLVVPTDTPFIEKSIIKQLLDKRENDKQAIIPNVNGHLQPLIGLYHHSTQKVILHLLENDQRSVFNLLNQIIVKECKFDDDRPFLNINHRSDYHNYIKNEENT
ncbi:molybdenum cofactor guanylyltransferase [Paraliobacillus zengyii]|uniref:molybdenum cofactor guanylyltransferase n=1 Tax=Paraliobacillus zengyii TaxID=2213194 RepID=UPI000E3D66C5|nr:molybdenum cofactor guanylyltransferase [Paraliobacillus zengyii]